MNVTMFLMSAISRREIQGARPASGVDHVNVIASLLGPHYS
jgi:hypothetical protein